MRSTQAASFPRMSARAAAEAAAAQAQAAAAANAGHHRRWQHGHANANPAGHSGTKFFLYKSYSELFFMKKNLRFWLVWAC
jgi:hypothetical protein